MYKIILSDGTVLEKPERSGISPKPVHSGAVEFLLSGVTA